MVYNSKLISCACLGDKDSVFPTLHLYIPFGKYIHTYMYYMQCMNVWDVYSLKLTFAKLLFSATKVVFAISSFIEVCTDILWEHSVVLGTLSSACMYM